MPRHDTRKRSATRPRDPRVYQIAVLGGLLGYGVSTLGFDFDPARAGWVLATVLGVQWAGDRLSGRRFDPRSPLISGLSLCLLLRTSAWPWAVAAAALAIGSKFLIRWRGRHVFNPTNFGLVALMGVTEHVWVSPGQWGSLAFFGFGLACLGGIVVRRAARADVTLALLASHVALLFGRAVWLGDPWAIPLHQLQSGALLIFAFFMISDPKTTPRSRAGRIAFGAGVAALGAALRFGLYEPNGLLFALALSAPLVPLLDRLLPGPAYRWPGPARAHTETPSEGEPSVPSTPTRPAAAPAALRA